jgi:hypothetical protein
MTAVGGSGSVLRHTGCEITASSTLTGTSSGIFSGGTVSGACVVGAGCSLKLAGCDITGVISGAGATDVRGSNYNGNANLGIGPGTVNRSVFTGSFGPTAVGANPVAFAPTSPYPDTIYNVNLQLTADPFATGSAGVTVTGKAVGGFTINDPIGGHTFDYTVIHD